MYGNKEPYSPEFKKGETLITCTEIKIPIGQGSDVEAFICLPKDTYVTCIEDWHMHPKPVLVKLVFSSISLQIAINNHHMLRKVSAR